MNTNLIMLAATVPDAFITRETIGTFAVMVTAVFAVCNASQLAFNFKPKWLGLVLSIGICFVLTWQTAAPAKIDWFLAFVNGCMVFSAAAGGTSMGNRGTGNQPAVRGNGKRGFLSPWF